MGTILKILLLDGTQDFSMTLCQAQRGSSLAFLKHGCEMGTGGSREPGSAQAVSKWQILLTLTC